MTNQYQFSPLLPTRRYHAFSLIELLTVLAIIGILVSLAIPSLSSLGSSGNVNRALLNISLLLEQSRAHALANNTYVWVGFNEEGETLSVASVVGTTGSSDDISSNAFRPLSKTKSFDNITLGPVAGITDLPEAEQLTPNPETSFTQSQGGKTHSFSRVIEFAPNGGARLRVGSIPRWIQVGILPVNAGENKEAAIQVAGLSGQVRIFRH